MMSISKISDLKIFGTKIDMVVKRYAWRVIPCAVALLVVEAASAQNPMLRDIPPNTARDLGSYDCTAFEALGAHALPNCRTITDYGGMVFDPVGYRALVWGGGHAATYRDDVEVFDLSTLRWAPDTPPHPARR